MSTGYARDPMRGDRNKGDSVSKATSRVLKLGAIGTAFLLVMSTAVAVSAANASIVVPSMAAPDSTITVAGSGFGASQSGVLTVNGIVVKTFTASGSGAFQVPISLPNSAQIDSVGRVSAKTPSGTVIATTTLTVGANVTQPTLFVPASAAPGHEILVAGAGFAGRSGKLTLNGLCVTTFAAASDGTFSVPFDVPAAATIGVGRISAKTSTDTLIATTTLGIGVTVSDPIVFAPDAAAVGDQLVAYGLGFGTGQTGVVTLNGLKMTTFSASASGSWTAAFAIPSCAINGTNRVSAKTADGALIATTTLTIASSANPPAPTAPPAPTRAPTAAPTAAPTKTPTAAPTKAPTAAPTKAPTPVPTKLGPTQTPKPTASPTAKPTATPTPRPTPTPTPRPTAIPTPVPTSPPTPVSLPNWSHVYVIYFENREYSQVVGSSQAPFINSLIAKYGLSTNFYAERHPSEPNYIALTSGGLQGTSSDANYDLNVDNLYKQVEASGRSWAEVQQGWPGGCFTGSSSGAVVDGVGKSGAYVRKHNPAISYTSISGNSAECSKITNLASFNPAGANFQFITPNMINDMHDGTIADGDNWLKAFLPQITNSSAFANSVVFVTFDEGTTNVNGGGQIMTIAITPNMTAGYKATANYTHYSMLRTIEQAWGLPYLGNAASASAMAFPY